MFRNRGQRRPPSLGLILLLSELFRMANNQGIPTVTLVTTVSQILIFLQIIPFPSGVRDVCLSFDGIVNRKQYLRLILSQLTHGDDWHLYYNMVSFLWKGRTLETRFGSLRFALTLIIFTISTSFTYVLVNKLMAEATEDYDYLYHCAVGFSGVIFALKVLTTYYDRSHISYVMGFIPISSKYTVWAELVLIQMVSPNASFVGHLAGILVGLAYIYGPLYYVIEILMKFMDPIADSNSRSNRHNNYRNNRGTQHSNNSYNESNYRSNYSSYAPNNISEEEQLRRAYEESLRSSNVHREGTAQPTAPPYPTDDNYSSNNYQTNPSDAETLRRLRLRHYQNY